MFVDFLEKSVVEDALAKIGKSLGFSLKHGSLDVHQGRAVVGSPLWWWYEYELSREEDGNAVDKVLLECHSSTSLKNCYIESAFMLEDVLATREFIVRNSICGNRHALLTHISNPFIGTRSLEELQMKLDLLDERRKVESRGSK